jgi:ribosomal protein L15
MRKIYLFTLLAGLVLFISSNYTYSQASKDTSKASGKAQLSKVVGKIYTKAKADSLYGPVLKADTIKTKDLAKLAKKNQKYMMFNLIDGKACILNSKRAVISGAALTIKPEQEFRLFSTSKVLELIKKGGSDITTVETRANTITLTNGAIAMEESEPCPPHCP